MNEPSRFPQNQQKDEEAGKWRDGCWNHRVRWNGRDEIGNSIASGIYFYRFSTGDCSKTKRMLLLK